MSSLQQQNGSTHVVIVVVLVIAILGALGYALWHTLQTKSTPNQSVAGIVTWSFDMPSETWRASATPPECKQPFIFDQSPVDINKVTSILYPGQTRGGNYKPHGGFGFDGQKDNKVTVKMPYDAYLVSGARYYEAGELQYLFDFVSSCGIAIRFDHLAVVSDRLQQLADQYLPKPEPDNSKGTPINPPVLFKSGEVIATAVGFTKVLNVGVDFGVYDYRARNQASIRADFQAAHGNFSATTYYGVCWFDMLPEKDAARVKSLPSRDQSMGKTSDYCQ